MIGHLIHIGYAKAGSTFLQRWFEAHPQLAYRGGGICGFNTIFQIGNEAVARGPRPLYRVTSSEDLSSPRPNVGNKQANFDRNGRASMAEEERAVFDILCPLFPNATILVITRGFRSIALSSYSQYLRSGGELSFTSLVNGAQHERPWNYDRLISLYREGFGHDRVIVLPFELLRDDPEAFCQHLQHRLGLNPVSVSRARVNEALSPVELAWYPRLAAFARRVPIVRRRGIGMAAFTNRLRLPIRLLQMIYPIEQVTEAAITDEMLESLRGQAECLRDEPLFAAYKKEYLL
jgi:hypothetical protein